jgi:isoleucyl-tRNA synthetase
MNPKFTEVKQLNYPDMEKDILSWWEAHRVFEKSLESRVDGSPFTFYEGPPTANGKPGIHHVMARTVKDLFCRYKTLKGFRVERKAGWDTHGLPVEIEVEKALGLKGRAQVEEYGIAEYNKACRESVLKYKDLWDNLTKTMGYWVDLDDPYITFENRYIESIWWALRTLYDKEMLYKGYKIQWYSPGSGTVLSSHEVSLGYKEVQDPSVYVRFRLTEAPDTYFLAWTTTPWTLVSNMALAVNPEIEYVLIRHKNGDITEHLILAANRLVDVVKEDYEVLRSIRGSELIGKTYEPIYPFATQTADRDQAWRVLPGAFVTTEDGTGIVHMAPAFGADDFDICMREGIPMYNPIDRDGCFNTTIEPYSGMWFKDADKAIVRDLKASGVLFRQETYLHNYPHDWRKGTPLMSYPVESWFIRTTQVRDRMVEINKTINWKPESTGTGRFGSWLENNVDWAISRQRYWGTPLPIWVSDTDPTYMECIGSVAELREKAGIADDVELDLHRPFIDDITWLAPDGGTMRRVTDLIDVWFDSGAMPFAQHHYPFENKDIFKEQFPADFIAEGVDQTRGWFYTLHALGTMLFDKPAYLNVVSNGLVLDAKGEKMSKSKGNTVDPFATLAEFGADSTRWYMISNASPWDNLKFSTDGIKEIQRRVFNTVVNTYSFFALYANIDGFTYSGKPISTQDRPEMDRWIISRKNTVIKESDAYFEAYEPTKAVRAIEEFIEEMSNWYVRRSRRRFWKEGDTADKTAAYQTLFECLLAVSKMMSPVAPFVSEWLFQRLNDAVKQPQNSVHISFYPAVNETAIDADLEHRMDLARKISSLVLRIRNKIGVNVRQPLARIILPIQDHGERDAIDSMAGIIKDEVNIKSIEYVSDETGIVDKKVKPNFPILGKKIGGLMKAVAAKVATFDNEAINSFERDGQIAIDIDGTQVTLVSEDLDILRSGIHGWEVESDFGISVAADTKITDELRNEGLAREFVNRVQNMRKEADFDVTDRISISWQGGQDIGRAVEAMKLYIAGETLATVVQNGTLSDYDLIKSWDIEGIDCTIMLKKIHQN